MPFNTRLTACKPKSCSIILSSEHFHWGCPHQTPREQQRCESSFSLKDHHSYRRAVALDLHPHVEAGFSSASEDKEVELSSSARLKQTPTADGIQLSVHGFTAARKTKTVSFCRCLALQKPSPLTFAEHMGSKAKSVFKCKCKCGPTNKINVKRKKGAGNSLIRMEQRQVRICLWNPLRHYVICKVGKPIWLTDRNRLNLIIHL